MQYRIKLPTGYTYWMDAGLDGNTLGVFPSNAYAWMTQNTKTAYVSDSYFGPTGNLTLQKSSEARKMGLIASVGSFIFYALIIYLIVFGTITTKKINPQKNKSS